MNIVIHYEKADAAPVFQLDGMGEEVSWTVAVNRARQSARGLEGLIYTNLTERIACVTHTPRGWSVEMAAIEPGDIRPKARLYPYLLPAQLRAQIWILEGPGKKKAKS